MTGVILCGGASSRMGQDKSLLLQRGAYWVQHAVELFDHCGLQYVLSVAEHNHAALRGAVPHARFVVDDGTLSIGGPLAGLLSVHLQFPEEDLLVLAVDMPAMQPRYVHRLVEAAKGDAVDCILFRNGAQLEPLCALYAAKALASILQRKEAGRLQRHSMHYVLDHLTTRVISIDNNPAFHNYNYPEDLGQL